MFNIFNTVVTAAKVEGVVVVVVVEVVVEVVVMVVVMLEATLEARSISSTVLGIIWPDRWRKRKASARKAPPRRSPMAVR